MKYLLLFLEITFALSTAFAADRYRTYNNLRFHYSVSYPSKILYPQGESVNGDGEQFLSEHGDVRLLVYGSNNTSSRSLEDLYYEAARGYAGKDSIKVVTHKVLKDNWFEIWGYKNGKLFQEKTILRRDQTISVYFEYPENDKSSYGKFATPIINSLKYR